MRRLCLLLCLLCACSDNELNPSPRVVEAGEFTVAFTREGLRVERAGRVLLSSAQGEAPYTPAAVRRTEATWEMSFGSWKITDGDDPWTGAEHLTSLFNVEIESPAEGVLELQFFAKEPENNRVSLAFECAPDDHFLGFGAQADGIDHRGHKVPIWTSEPGIGKSESDDPPVLWFVEGARHDSSMGLPTWLSSRGYVGVVDNPQRSIFELCSERDDAWRVEVWDRQLRLWIYDGPEPATALERATGGVLGRQMQPPPLAFAPWNDAIFGPDEVRRVAQLIRDEGVPSSAIWTEDFRGGEDVETQGYRLKEEWALDRSLYPDAEALAAELAAMGIAWFAYFNTFLVESTEVYQEALAGGHLVQNEAGEPYSFEGVTFEPSGIADISRPETREWIKGYMRDALDIGFTGWMADFAEWLPHDAKLHSGEDPKAAHNLYPLEWQKVNAEVLAERDDGVQRLYFTRSGWMGSGAHAPVFWAGDQRTSFQPDDGMVTVIPMGMNLGLAGVSTYGHDIAGYQSASNPTSDKELFFRWTTLGALSPVMRTHHGLSARENWSFDADDETLAHYKRWAALHIELFPYLDGGSLIAETRGIPLMRALPLAYPDDAEGWTLSDQYLLGPHLLVAPVVERDARARSVYLPEGRWLPWATGEGIDGGQRVDVDVPLEEVALFAAAGAVIPMLPEGVQSLLPAEAPVVDYDDVADQRVLRVFLGGEGAFTERDGTRYSLSGTPAAVGDFQQGATVLNDCVDDAARGCVAERDDAARVARVRLGDDGDFQGGGQTLEISGSARQLDLIIRW